jgi:predicted DNA-binding protein (MmcQ/YjbR family)
MNLEQLRAYFLSLTTYLARHKWVYIQEDHTLTDKKLKELIAKSYELVKAKLPAKLRKELK